MSTIKLNKITFGDTPFRKLRKLTINIASSITLISGHNGIGKSTILGLLANSSGLTQHIEAPRSYFGKMFQANLSEIIFIDYETEFLDAHEADSLPNPIIEYTINENEPFSKRCALTDRKKEGRARIVPRNYRPSSKEFISADQTIKIGEAAKVPLPTIYLGMTRVLPLGEVAAGSVSSDVINEMPDEDRKTIADFINQVIVGADAAKDAITSNKIKGTSKFSSHPKYGYDAKCVSLGQDSLGSIAAAIASFQMLKREWSDYPGGLLIIDELDSGFHPHAIGRLVKQLEKFADQLSLQIIATTHSTRLIQAVYPKVNNSKNAVAYLMDTRAPALMTDPSLRHILDDMDLTPPKIDAAPKKEILRIYAEDAEAAYLLNLLIPPGLKRSIGHQLEVTIKPIALGVGCDSLANLSLIDPHFRLAMFALDADAKIQPKHRKHKNIVKLPGDGQTSPERTLFNFVRSLVEDRENHPTTWATLLSSNITTDHVNAHLLNWDGDVSTRKAAKKWWKDRQAYIKDWKLFEAWMAENPNAVGEFRSEFNEAAKVVAKRLRGLAKSGLTS